MHGYIFTSFWLITLKLGKFVNSRPSFQQCQWIFINKSEMESCKKFVEGPISNFIYGWNFAGDISQMKWNGRLFFHILQYFTGVFSPSVCKFIAKRDYENHNSGILAWVTSFTGEDTLGLIELNEFVFGANPRVDILHRVVVWQRAKRRAVSKLEYWFTCDIVVESTASEKVQIYVIFQKFPRFKVFCLSQLYVQGWVVEREISDSTRLVPRKLIYFVYS